MPYGYDDPSPSDVRQVMTDLKALSVTTVRIDFSGGNDEGGADGIDFLDADGNIVEGIPKSNAYSQAQYRPETRDYGPAVWMVSQRNDETGKYESRPATDDEIRIAKITKVLEAPIYAKYYSFAGEFYVHGTLTWDVASGKSEMHGHEGVREWVDF